MELPVYFPNVKTRSTKDLIIRLLTEERSLTNQKIFNAIKKKFAVSVTYQAVRQALMELTEANVLEKVGKDYSISTKWIESLHNFSLMLKDKFIENKSIKIIDKNTKEIQLNSLNDMGHFVLFSFKDYFFDMDRQKDLYMIIHNLWFPFTRKEKRDALIKFFSVNKNYVYVANKGFVNRFFYVFYKKYCNVKLGFKFDEFFDIIIQGDCVAKIYMPKELRERMDKAYSSRNPFNFRIIDEFSDFTFHPYPIKIIITRNKEMAEEMKELIRKK